MSLRRSTRSTLFIWLLLPALCWGQDALLRGTVDSVRESDRIVVEGDRLLSGRLLAELYDRVGYEPVWKRPEQVRALLAAIDEAGAQGLRPSELHRGTVRSFAGAGGLDRPTRAARIGAELRLSDALLRYLIQVRYGRLDPVKVNPAWNHRPPIAVPGLIESAKAVLQAPDTRAALADAIPRPFFYQDMLKGLERYARGERLKDLPEIPGGRNLALGSRGERVGMVRERLALLGESPADPPLALETFDKDLRDVVVAFQRRSGLTPDGIIGPSTLAALNRPYDPSGLEQIRINLERMRWFYDALPEDFVFVDVAGFMAYVVRGGQVAWSTRVVVGTPDKQTPSFRDEMEVVVFNPTWIVPKSIQKTMRSVGSTFKVINRRTGRAVSGGDIHDHSRYLLVQQPGPKNALGRVKFLFPNNQAVYMHDTPSKHLFARRVRAYSHGCVRVKDPLTLAEVILNRPSWNQSQISRVLHTSRTRYVKLDRHLPVILYYLTAFADADGRVAFRSDVYDRDAALEQAFAGDASPPRLRFPEPVAITKPAPASTPPAKEPAATPSLPAHPPLPGTTLTRDPTLPSRPTDNGSTSPGAIKPTTAPRVPVAAIAVSAGLARSR